MPTLEQLVAELCYRPIRHSAHQQLASSGNADISQLRIEFERVHAAFASDARLLGPAEGSAQITQEPRVDPDVSGLYRRSHPERAADVAGPNGGRESVGSIIRQPDDFLLG